MTHKDDNKKNGCWLYLKGIAIALITLVVFFTGLLLFVTPSYGMGETGSIELNVFYSNGDRVELNGLTLKIYQDTNSTVYRIAYPDTYPAIIDSLPIDHKYKIDIYRESMYGASEYVDLKDNFEKIDTVIPLDAGLKFQVFYNDGVTPISNATVSIKSFDGLVWAKSTTDEKGNSKRLWLQSAIKDGEYFLADISLGQFLNYEYPSHILLGPGSKTNSKIVTPWPSLVDQITISVYKSPTEKVKAADGNYVVVLSTTDGNQVAQSKIDSHGQAYFTNFKADNYDIHVIKTSPNSPLDQEVAIKNMLIAGNQPQISIFLQSITSSVPVNLQNGTVQYQVNATATVKPPQFVHQDTCNCVIFRLDDVQDHFVRASDLAIMNLFTLKHKDLTLGIVTNYTGNDKAIVETVKQGVSKNLFFPALHGYDHIDYTTLTAFDQYQSLKLSNEKMNQLLGNTTDIFIPPYNHFNNVTLDGLQRIGVKIISAGSSRDDYIYHFTKDHQPFLNSSQIYHMPQVSEFPLSRAVEINYFSTVSEDDVMRDLKINLKNLGYSVITLHPQDMTDRDSHQRIINTNNSLNQTQIQNLAHLIDRIDNENYTIANYYAVAGLSPRQFPVSYNSSFSTQDPSMTNIFTLGKGSTGVAVNPDTDMIYITNSKTNSVSVIDGKVGGVYGTIPVGDIPVGISINTKTNMIYVVNSYSGTVSVINGVTNTVSQTLNIGTIAYGVAVNPAINTVYFIDPYVPAVDFVDGDTNKIVSTVKVEGSPQRITVNPTTNMIYVTNSKSDSVSVIDGSTKTVVNTIQLGNGDTPLGIAVNPTTNMIYVTNSKSDSVSVIDGSTKTVVNTIQLGNGDTPLGIAVNPTTNMIYVTNSKSDSVSVIDGSTNTIVNTIHVGGGNFLSGVTVNDVKNRIYVANLNSGTLGIIEGNMGSNSKSTVPEFNLATLMIFSISISALIFLTRLKMLNIKK